MVNTDRNLLRRLIQNLVSNGIDIPATERYWWVFAAAAIARNFR